MDPERIGRYEVKELLGQGGMGRVYLAIDSVLGRRVAIKLVRDDLGLPPEVKRSLFDRMRNEAKAAAALTHPNVVTLHDMGETDEVGLFLVFAYVEGPTLRERIENGPLPPIEVSKIALDLGGALTHAHQNGVIHRDVKPENVILSPAGAVLTDFGIARIPDSTLTMPQTLIGTAAYSAPETRSAKTKRDDDGDGTPPERFGPAADQFSLAATLYEALAGARAFPGEDIVAVVEAVNRGDPILLADTTQDERLRIVLGRADGVIRRALSPAPEDRYASCRAFADALASGLDARVSGAFTIPPPSRTSIVPRATRRWQNILLGLALLVIVGLWAFGRRGASGNEDKPAASASASVVSAPPKPTAPKATVRPPPSATPSATPSTTASALPPLPPPE
jgi:serine/threonine-protein kinase